MSRRCHAIVTRRADPRDSATRRTKGATSVVFKRRDRLTWTGRLQALVWPRGGWRRGLRYVWVRLTRLPDPPHRIARGIWAGIFVSFTPLFGLHILAGAILAWIMRGNILASLLATLVGNPLTFPLIAVTSMQLGHLLLGNAAEAPAAAHILVAFAQAGGEFWANVKAVFTTEPTRWSKLYGFYDGFFLPYLVGGIIPGVVAATAGYFASLPMITAYQALRDKRRQARRERAADPR